MWFTSSNSFLLFVISRTFGGLFKGNIGLSTAIVTDLSDEKERCTGMAFIGIAFSLGFIVGPMLGAYLSTTFVGKSYYDGEFSVIPALIAVILSIINIIYTSVYFKESNDNLAKVSKSSFSLFIRPHLFWSDFVVVVVVTVVSCISTFVQLTYDL